MKKPDSILSSLFGIILLVGLSLSSKAQTNIQGTEDQTSFVGLIPMADLDPNSVTIVTPALHGTAVVNPNGSGSTIYTPNSNYNGTDSYQYQVCKISAPTTCITITVTVDLAPAKDPPIVSNDSGSTSGVLPVVIPVFANDTSIDGTLVPDSIQIIGGPLHGTTSIDPLTGDITYTADADFYGADTFFYKVGDAGGFDYAMVIAKVNAPFTFTNITCANAMDGSIDTTHVFGGTPPYSFFIVVGGNPFPVTGFPKTISSAGEYTMVIRDDNGFTDSTVINITQPEALSVLDTHWIGVLCSGDTAEVFFSVIGGTRPYTIEFSGIDDTVSHPFDTAFTFIPQVGAIYTITVTDANLCQRIYSLYTETGLFVETEGYLSGEVLMADGSHLPLSVGDVVEVSLIKHSESNNLLWETVQTYLITLPNEYHYEFPNITPGLYALKAKYLNDVPGYNFVPTYCPDVSLWELADTMEIAANCTTLYREIKMVNPPLDTGVHSISGYIYVSDFFWKTETDPIPLIDVVVEKDSVFSGSNAVFEPYTHTSVSATLTPDVYYYRFDILDTGTYKVNVVIDGITQITYYTNSELTIIETIDSITHIDFCVDIDSLGIIDTCSTFPVGIANVSSSDIINIFPNPTSGQLNLILPDSYRGKTEVSVYSAIGKRVQTLTLAEKDNLIKLANDLAKGVYFLDISNGGNRHRQLLIKE